ncbi:MAG TPA: N-acetylmuramic acid 6-phosphate etherase [Candidatus Acidoferrales bacterium]|nr:N-acetylmuramic acid 6-phosphate etherase [Candidatus Acidoferrales bacterium]
MSERATEARNPRASALASFSTTEILELMNDEDATVPAAVRAALPAIARAVDAIVAALAEGGHVIYVGAGTSGRLGVLDASEAPPTFGVERDLFRGIIAGGDTALRNSVEGAEDVAANGARDLGAIRRAHDVVVGISASGRAPYVIAAVEAGRKAGSPTVAVTCNPGSPLAAAADIPIVVEVGPEVLAGSSRLKAGTATKLVLNMLSTAAMIRAGRTKGDLMVDLRATNAKLRERAVRMVRDETGLDEAAARDRLEKNGWNVRAALATDRQR